MAKPPLVVVIGGLFVLVGIFGLPPVLRNWSNLVDQLDSPEERVARAREEKETGLRGRFKEAGVAYPAKRLFFRAFKRERELELWAGDGQGSLKLIRTYQVAAASGELGPKRKEGDRQVPEGIYVIDRFNPRSSFHLSLGLNYPNASDRIRSDKKKPGGDIFIHGDQRSIGCLAMTDPIIREIYICALDAQRPIAVHIFPTRLDAAGMRALASEYASQPELVTFWRELQPIYAAFEKNRQVPKVSVDASGAYRLQ